MAVADAETDGVFIPPFCIEKQLGPGRPELQVLIASIILDIGIIIKSVGAQAQRSETTPANKK